MSIQPKPYKKTGKQKKQEEKDRQETYRLRQVLFPKEGEYIPFEFIKPHTCKCIKDEFTGCTFESIKFIIGNKYVVRKTYGLMGGMDPLIVQVDGVFFNISTQKTIERKRLACKIENCKRALIYT